MNKERIKSFILILLIINSINLTLQMWFDSKLWNKEAFWDALKDTPVIGDIIAFFDKDDEEYIDEQLYDKTMKPRRVVVNGGGAREVYLKETENYNVAMQYVDGILTGINSKNVTVDSISYEEWKNLFKTKSLYVDYGYSMNAASLNRMYGMSVSSGKFAQASGFSGLIIVPDITSGTCTICMLNESNNVVTRHVFSADTTALYNFIEQTTYQKQQNDTFAFEINLDVLTSAEDEVERKVAFSPLTLLTIPIGNETNGVLQNNGAFESYEKFEEFAEKTLNAFGYNASSLRKIVKKDGTISFVENKATITFYYDGTIEYNAVSKESGLRFSNGSTGATQAVHDVLNIAGTIWEISGIDAKNLDYHLVSDISDNDDSKYTVKLDNMYRGTTIRYSTLTNNAVYAQVDEGYITKFIIHLSDITETGQNTESAPVLMAIDKVYESYAKPNMIIDDVYRCYVFDEAGKGTVKWAFEIRDDDKILMVDTSDLY